MDVKAVWAAEEAKTAEERRGGRKTAGLNDMVPWTVQAASVPKYKAIHSVKPLELSHKPGQVHAFGHGFYYFARDHANDAKNTKAIQDYNKSLPKEEGSVRIHYLFCYLIRPFSAVGCAIDRLESTFHAESAGLDKH